jgi:TetR/AcrR family transcriptional regulator, cholesterol catabolism regulator
MGPHRARDATRQSRAGRRRSPRLKPGAKRDQIIDVATDYFGRYGFEETKWADVAAAVGIGSTALYHYFESKQHCLYEIMIRTIDHIRERFDRVVADHAEWPDALVELLVAGFELTDTEVLRHRVLLSEHGRVAGHRDLPREEAAREGARARKRDLERAWSGFLARGIQQGHVPTGDAQLLARALLGLYCSVWSWYRPGGPLPLAEVGRFYVSRELALLGADPDLASDRFAAAQPAAG